MARDGCGLASSLAQSAKASSHSFSHSLLVLQGGALGGVVGGGKSGRSASLPVGVGHSQNGSPHGKRLRMGMRPGQSGIGSGPAFGSPGAGLGPEGLPGEEGPEGDPVAGGSATGGLVPWPVMPSGSTKFVGLP